MVEKEKKLILNEKKSEIWANKIFCPGFDIQLKDNSTTGVLTATLGARAQTWFSKIKSCIERAPSSIQSNFRQVSWGKAQLASDNQHPQKTNFTTSMDSKVLVKELVEFSHKLYNGILNLEEKERIEN